MVFRALLAIWFLTTSVLGPALCCCSPTSPRTPAHTEATANVNRASFPASPSGCPHCKEDRARKGSQKEQKPSEAPKRCPGKCPCREHALASALLDGHEVRALVQSSWLPIGPAIDYVFSVYPPFPENSPEMANHTGPPPIGGVELLHRLHILIC